MGLKTVAPPKMSLMTSPILSDILIIDVCDYHKNNEI